MKQEQKRVRESESQRVRVRTLAVVFYLAMALLPIYACAQERISLDLKGIEIVELFKLLSQKINLNIVPSKSVTGRINVYLNNLTYEDALDVILVSQDLAADRQGNIINVMTAAEYEKLYGKKYNEKRKFVSVKLSYAKPATVFAAVSQLKSDIGKVIVDEASATLFLLDSPETLVLMKATIGDMDKPPQTKIFNLEYAKPEDIKTQLSGLITSGPGEVLVDPRSTKVVVSDLPERMKKIERVIRAFDAETPQVLIDTKIVEVTLKDEFQRDNNWEKILNNLVKNISSLDFKGTFPVAPAFTPSPALAAASMLMSMGTLSENDFTEAIKILQTFGDTRVISQPRILTANNQESKIMVGSREAYVIQSLSQGQSTTVSAENINFIDVGVKLNVLPTINRDEFITMKIKPEVSSVREVITTTLGSRIPIVDTSELETVLKVKNGTMIMLGGMEKLENRDTLSGTPGLSKTPFLNVFFSSRAKQKKRTEVIVFLIPRIVSGSVNLEGADINDWEAKKMAAGFLPPAGTAGTAATSANIQQKLKGFKEY